MAKRTALFAIAILLGVDFAQPALAQDAAPMVEAFERVCLTAVQSSRSPSALAESAGFADQGAPPANVAPFTPLSRYWRASTAEFHILTAPVGPPATPYSCMVVAAPSAAAGLRAAFAARLIALGYAENASQTGEREGVFQAKYDKRDGERLFSALLIEDTRPQSAATRWRAVSYCVGCVSDPDAASRRSPIN